MYLYFLWKMSNTQLSLGWHLAHQQSTRFLVPTDRTSGVQGGLFVGLSGLDLTSAFLGQTGLYTYVCIKKINGIYVFDKRLP